MFASYAEPFRIANPRASGNASVEGNPSLCHPVDCCASASRSRRNSGNQPMWARPRRGGLSRMRGTISAALRFRSARRMGGPCFGPCGVAARTPMGFPKGIPCARRIGVRRSLHTATEGSSIWRAFPKPMPRLAPFGTHSIMPAATVSLVPSSIRMKEPVWRLRW